MKQFLILATALVASYRAQAPEGFDPQAMNANSYDSPAETGGNREDLRNVLTILEPEDTPFTSSVKKGPSPKATFVEVLADTLRTPRKSGTKEGADASKGGNKALKRARFGTYVHRVFDTFGVTDVQQIVSQRGGTAAVDDEYGSAKAKCVREVKRDIEAICLGDQEHQGGSDTDMKTRGFFNWVKATAQTSNPVPADFRPAAAQVKTGVGTTVPLFTEDALNAVCKALKKVYGGKRTFQMIAGDDVVETVDKFTRVNENTTNTRYRVTEMSTNHEITLMVQVFESSFARLEIIPGDFIKLVDSTGLGDPTAAAIVNQALWELQFLDALHSADLDDEGGGPSGYVKAMMALTCLNPKGNGAIYNS